MGAGLFGFLDVQWKQTHFARASTHERPKDSAMPFVIHPFDTPAATPNWHAILGKVMGGVSVSPMRLSHV